MDLKGRIEALSALLIQTGRLWTGTKLSGYAENGPYHCDDCIFLKGRKEGKIWEDAEGKGRCNNAFTVADEEVKHDEEGLAIVNIKKGCCEFVDESGLEDTQAIMAARLVQIKASL